MPAAGGREGERRRRQLPRVKGEWESRVGSQIEFEPRGGERMMERERGVNGFYTIAFGG